MNDGVNPNISVAQGKDALLIVYYIINKKTIQNTDYFKKIKNFHKKIK